MMTSSMAMPIINEKMVIRKGPWKPEEDKVLINHVNMYGPRDWSSIRSKGLLLRTGKSCRLRWVNKLRPHLKTGCKFTAEEERVVIEMQAQIGNKWATIAAHLPGRTDNDVKNFWSSRQKRLARILRSQSHSSSLPKAHKSTSSTPCSVSVQAPKTISLIKAEPSSNKQLTSSSYTATASSVMVSKPMSSYSTNRNPSNYDSNTNTLFIDSTKNPNTSGDFSSIPLHSVQTYQHQQLPLFPLETQELIDRLDLSFFDTFVCTDEPALLDDGARLMPCSLMTGVTDNNPVTAPDSFFDDFPADMFDDIEPLP